MLCIKIRFLESEPSFYVWSRSRYFLPGAGAEKKYLEPEPRKNGSAPQHAFIHVQYGV